MASWWTAVRGTPLPHDFAWRRELLECGLNRASTIIAPTIAFAAETSRIYDLGRPVLAVHNGRNLMQQPQLPQGQFVFAAGRLWDEGKNVATLDAAAARVDIPFEVAGATEGPNGSRARFEHLHVLGSLSETRIAGLLATRPIFASAALYEPFGLSVLEAASSGCALVLSDIPTHRELWNGAAYFVAARDDVGFASAIADLRDNPRERDELGQLAKARAKRLTPQATATRMAEIYAQLAAADEQLIKIASAA
jgi:glycosyltransferase involved in cell wall biosynthesis